MQLKEQLFESALSELHRQTTSSDPFENLQTALLVRKLLMEGTPVIDVMNRRSRAPLVFRVRANADLAGSPVNASVDWLAGDDLDPAIAAHPPRVTLELRRDAFLAHEVGGGTSQSIRIRDIVELVARAMDDMHERTQPARDQVMRDIEGAYHDFVGTDNEANGALARLSHLLRAIARVTVKAAEPLRRQH